MADQQRLGASMVRRFHDTVVSPNAGLRVNRGHSSHGHQPFRPLPAPTGTPPYHLDLATVLQAAEIDAITQAGHLVFHLVGDTGGIKTPYPQQSVAAAMVNDYAAGGPAGPPAFFYHLGDVVYFFGQAEEYFPQFYEPYMHYPAPIFAIPGNHDGDLSRVMEAQGIPSLAAFVDNFCQRIPHHTRDALDATRHGMTQPNVYWTLETPVATIVGLYTNVPDGGQLDDDQINWLIAEMANAPAHKALIIAMHHPIYSIDDHHSGSVYMDTVLNEAMTASQRTPDAVFAGHVHNYQRFTRPWNGREVPFVVAGAGGYHNLHQVSKSLQDFPQQPPFTVPNTGGVVFETYCDDQFGYLRLDITAETLQGTYFTVADSRGHSTGQATVFDSFTLDLKTHKLTTHDTGRPPGAGGPAPHPTTPPAHGPGPSDPAPGPDPVPPPVPGADAGGGFVHHGGGHHSHTHTHGTQGSHYHSHQHEGGASTHTHESDSTIHEQHPHHQRHHGD